MRVFERSPSVNSNKHSSKIPQNSTDMPLRLLHFCTHRARVCGSISNALADCRLRMRCTLLDLHVTPALALNVAGMFSGCAAQNQHIRRTTDAATVVICCAAYACLVFIHTRYTRSAVRSCAFHVWHTYIDA